MAKIQFSGSPEEVVTRGEYPIERAREILSGKTIAVLGYGVQGPGQALNLRDNGFQVIIGQRKGGDSWQKAIKDNWVEGETLFSLEQACQKGDILCYLLSDAGQIEVWPVITQNLVKGKTLYFSHGFGIIFSQTTGMIPPDDANVILVAPKGSGTSLRRLFLEGKGINSSFAVHKDADGNARNLAIAMGIGIGSGYLFETTFRKEVTSDLTGERGTLMGAIQGLFAAQYDVLRKNGHSPSEAFNETVEEATESLYPLISENGMDWMYANCSTTAQRGALDWWKRFRDAVKPVFEDLYESVVSGREAEITIESNKRADYRKHLKKELDEIAESELWKVGRVVRKLRT